jgi:hypothetical protein
MTQDMPDGRIKIKADEISYIVLNIATRQIEQIVQEGIETENIEN